MDDRSRNNDCSVNNRKMLGSGENSQTKIISSPGHNRTHIAQICYSPSTAHDSPTSRDDTTPDSQINSSPSLHGGQPPKSITQEDFKRKKNERMEELRKLQSMIDGIGKVPHSHIQNINANNSEIENADNKLPPHPPLKAIEVEEPNILKPQQQKRENVAQRQPQLPAKFIKSKTESNIERPLSSRRETQRTGASSVRTQSCHLPTTASECRSTRRSYDPEEARRYMEEQKKKRRCNEAVSVFNAERKKTALEKDKIKQRLEQLRKCTKKIVSKNLSKKNSKLAPKPEVKKEETNNQQQEPQVPTTSRAQLGMGIVFRKGTERKPAINNPKANEVKANIPGNLAAREDHNEESRRVPTSRKVTLPVRMESDRKSPEPTAKSMYSMQSFSSAPLSENHKRIGLLRKPDAKEHSFSAIKELTFDKENVDLDMFTPKLPIPLETRLRQEMPFRDEIKPHAEDLANKKPDKPLIAACDGGGEGDISSAKKLELETPAQRLRTPATMREQSAQVKETDIEGETKEDGSKNQKNDPKDPTTLPYWLRPSSAQIYPYNFIMAVRRKLEAITNPYPPTAETKTVGTTTTKNKNTSTSDLPGRKHEQTPLTAITKNGHPPKRRLMIEKSNSPADSFSTHSLEPKPHRSRSHSQDRVSVQKSKSSSISELNSNLSSVSVQMVSSNTASELETLKSQKTHSRRNQSRVENDDTTVSSSVFDSPEKKLRHQLKPAGDFPFAVPRSVSPLNTDRVEHLKLASRAKDQPPSSKASHSRDTTSKTSSTLSPSRHTKETSSQGRQVMKKNEDEEKVAINFNKFLDDFNRSLSQVIEVNEKLKSQLDKSHRLDQKKEPQPKKIEKSSGESASVAYTADFEEISEQASPAEESSGSKKRTVNGKIAPEELEEKRESPKIDLDLADISNSSALSTASNRLNGNSDAREEELPQQPFEKRAEALEQLTMSLKKSIMDSRAKRELADTEETSRHTAKNGVKSSERESQATQDSDQGTDATSSLNSSEASIKTVADSPQASGGADDSIASKTFYIKKPSKTPPSSASGQSHSISEHILVEEVSPGKENTNGYSRRSMKQPSNSSISTIDVTPEKSPNAIATRSFINSSRGDFLPRTEADALHEADFKKAVKTAQSKINDETSSNSSMAPPSYTALAGVSHGHGKQSTARESSMGSLSNEIRILYSQTGMDDVSQHSSVSESSVNYSTVGLYDKLIQTETNKSEYLYALLKMREKALLDRTKGQIALLEVQKERYKAKGLIMQIAIIKKKQRGILLKMEKEREEIKRILQATTTTNTTTTAAGSPQSTGHPSRSGTPSPAKRGRDIDAASSTSQVVAKFEQGRSTPPPALLPLQTAPLKRSHRSLKQQQQQQKQKQSQELNTSVKSSDSTLIVRASYQLESNRPLEDLLLKREENLRRRRAHVERLMQWHRRLDQEEADVLQLERMLFDGNNAEAVGEIGVGDLGGGLPSQQKSQPPAQPERKKPPQRQHRSLRMERRLKDIDQSLRELNNISTTSNAPTVAGHSGGSGHNEDSSCHDSVSGSGSATNSAGATPTSDFVRTSGCKLNKLWRRLTSQQVEKFEPTRRYKLCKADLERLYEEAKIAVLNDFAEDEERITNELLERSISGRSSVSSSSCQQSSNHQSLGRNNIRPNVPHLNINLNSGPSDLEGDEQDEEEDDSMGTHRSQHGNYSPKAAEQDFQTRSSSSSSGDDGSKEGSAASCPASESGGRLKPAKEKTIAVPRPAETPERLKRSLSDSHVGSMPLPSRLSHSHSTASSQRHISTAISSAKLSSREVTIPTVDVSSPQSSQSAESTLRNVQSLDRATPGGDRSRPDTPDIPTEMESPPPSGISSDVGSTDSVADEAQVISAAGISEGSPAIPEMAVTASAESTPESVSVESKTQEISAKLDEISAAIAKLRSSSSTSPSSGGETTGVETAKSAETAQSTDEPVSTPTASGSSTTQQQEEEESLSTDPSYTLHFENTPTDQHSPSGCTLLVPSSSYLTEMRAQSSEASKILNHEKEDEEEEQEEESSGSETIVAPSQSQSIDRRPVSSSEAVAISGQTTSADGAQLSEESYEADFEVASATSKEVSRIEDLSMPHFEETLNCSQEPDEPEKQEEQHADDEKENVPNRSEVKTAVEPEGVAEMLTPRPPPPPPPPPPSSPGDDLEMRRCQQLLLESDQLKQYEHVTAVPYMYVREIPNKPPPPYVPPEHGSPMTTIFPSEERIKDITFRRSHELYCELLETDYSNDKGEPLLSVMDEKITNIYERIILDICREYLDEHRELLSKGDPTNFHSRLAFFNPPDRLKCIQQTIYKEVRRCLSMDKATAKRPPLYASYGQRSKRDCIGQLITQELYEEDEKWCQFHHEENEVLELIVDEMIMGHVKAVAREVLLEEGGTIEMEDDETLPDQIIDENGENAIVKETETMKLEEIEAEAEAEATCSAKSADSKAVDMVEEKASSETDRRSEAFETDNGDRAASPAAELSN